MDRGYSLCRRCRANARNRQLWRLMSSECWKQPRDAPMFLGCGSKLMVLAQFLAIFAVYDPVWGVYNFDTYPNVSEILDFS